VFRVAVFILVMRLVDVLWVIVPAFNGPASYVHWLDFALPIGIGGVWISMFARELKSVPPLPLNDPRFVEAPEHA
jgi:hypothetical protein